MLRFSLGATLAWCIAGCSDSAPVGVNPSGGSAAGGQAGSAASLGGIGGTVAASSGGAPASAGSGTAFSGAGGSAVSGSAGMGGQAAAGASGGSTGGGGGGAGGPTNLQIMPLGDSITVGSSGTNAGYRGPLYALLKRSGLQVQFVGSSAGGGITATVDPLPLEQRHNEGHSSYTISDVDNNLDGLDTATFERYGGAVRNPNGGHWFDGIVSGPNMRPPLYPDVITMMIGTNNASDPDRAAVQTELHALITKITSLRPDAQLIVAQITPSNRPNNVSYNAAVASEVAAFKAAGKHVNLVDMYTGFPPDGLSADGVHPNDTGYAFMSEKWFAAILAVTKAPR